MPKAATMTVTKPSAPKTPRAKKYRILKPLCLGDPKLGTEKFHAPGKGFNPSYPNLNYFQVVYGYPVAPETVPSPSHGGSIPVDLSGVIELSDDDAAQFTFGQIAPLDPEAPATSTAGIVDAELQRKKGYPGSDKIQGSAPEPGMAVGTLEEQNKRAAADE